MCCFISYHRNYGWNVVAGYRNRSNAPNFLILNNLFVPAVVYALHVLKIELTEDEMHVYNLMCYDDGELMLAEDGLAEDFVHNTIGKIEDIVEENAWMKLVHVY